MTVKERVLYVSEIFGSLQGEGVYAGVPMSFVRLQGCNLRCEWCDTPYAQGVDYSNGVDVAEVFKKICGSEWVCITGGEPLLQLVSLRRLCDALRARGCKVAIETNGSIDPPGWFKEVYSWSVDVKCPDSGSYGSFRTSWLRRLRGRDQLKFVVSSPEDLCFVRGFCRGTRTRAQLLVSPVATRTQGLVVPTPKDERWSQIVWRFCVENDLRYSLQVHKAVFGSRRGV